MFKRLVSHFELIFGLLTIPKCDLLEVQKEMFERFAWYFQNIFALWSSQKCDLGEVKNRPF